MTRRTYFECDNSKCTTKIMIESTSDFCEDVSALTIIKCEFCDSEYCEKCQDCIIESGYECGHHICNDDYCKEKHFWQCELLNRMYQRRENNE